MTVILNILSKIRNSYNVSHSVTDFKIKVAIFRELKNKIVCSKLAEL